MLGQKPKPARMMKIGDTVESEERAPASGYYIYLRHVNEKESHSGCYVPEKARSGLFIAKGSNIPGLICCEHKVLWQFVTPSAST